MNNEVIKIDTMTTSEFSEFCTNMQLRPIKKQTEYTTDKGGNAVYVHAEYYQSPDGRCFKYVYVPRGVGNLKKSEDSLKGDIEKLDLNIRNLIKALCQEKHSIEINRNILKIKHPLSLIKKRLTKEILDEKELEQRCISILRQSFEDEFTKNAKILQHSETLYIQKILSTNEIKREGYSEIITALMQLYQIYLDRENENE